MEYKPVRTFDTSGINCLADDPDSDLLIAHLRAGSHTRFTFTNILEIIANEDGERRRKLFDTCSRLLASGDCIDPQRRVMQNMVAGFEQTSPFDWTEVGVRFPAAERAIARRMDFSDDHARREREKARACEKEFRKMFADMRPAFDSLYEMGTDRPPANASDWVNQARINGGPFWILAGKLYSYVANHAVDEATIRRFVAQCPPFHAWVIALSVAMYDRCMRPTKVSPSLKSERNDIIMSFSFPYCRQIVSDDRKLLACYREVVSICGLNVAVLSYQKFRETLLLAN